MHKNTRTVLVSAVVAVVALAGMWLGRDLLLGTSGEITCDDGQRRTIDLREFTTRYWAYSVEFAATLQDAGKLEGKLAPQRIHALNDAQLQANEFRKYLVAGFNACALSKAQYADYGVQFQALDAVARQIDGALGRTTLGTAERERLDGLVTEYSNLVAQFARVKP